VTAQLQPRPLPFSARHYEDRLKGLPDQRSKGYHRGQTERLVRDLISEVVQVQSANALLLTERDAANDARRLHADSRAAASHAWEQDGPPTMAIEAVVVGQQLAERHDRAANAEIARRLANADSALANARRSEAEAQRLLDEATAGVTVLELPPEPERSDDVPSDLEARARYLAERKQLVARHYEEALEALRQKLHDQEAELADQERELLDRQSDLLSELDRIAETVPAVRAVLVDLTAGEPTQAIEQVAS
jgi:hypothetical protein